MQTLATIIEEARLKKGFSYEELEEKSTIRVPVVQMIESGKRKKTRVNTLYQLSKTLELDFVELLTICGYIKTEKSSLGRIIWNARLSKNLTREELAEKCFMCREGIAFIERDEVRPRESTLEVLAKELDLNLEELLKFCGNSEVEKARLNAAFTQEQLAKKSGVELKTVKSLEEGKARPRVRTLEKIVKVLPELNLQELKEKYGYF